MVTNSPVLVLNQNYQPLNICTVRRAVVLIDRGRAELLTNGRGHIYTISLVFPIPSVIRLMNLVKRPATKLRLSRRAVFHRDGFTCQYCGASTSDLTVDHVVPRSRGGSNSWENVVSACIPCNHRKAGLTLKEAAMTLLREPRSPRPNPYYLFDHRPISDDWRQFIPWAR